MQIAECKMQSEEAVERGKRQDTKARPESDPQITQIAQIPVGIRTAKTPRTPGLRIPLSLEGRGQG